MTNEGNACFGGTLVVLLITGLVLHGKTAAPASSSSSKSGGGVLPHVVHYPDPTPRPTARPAPAPTPRPTPAPALIFALARSRVSPEELGGILMSPLRMANDRMGDYVQV